MNLTKTLILTVALCLSLSASAFANCGRPADVDPASPGASLRQARSTTLCLLNVQRARHHLRKLRFNHKLALAGLRHARDMVSNQYFSHDAPSGQDFVQRILNTNYVPAA